MSVPVAREALDEAFVLVFAGVRARGGRGLVGAQRPRTHRRRSRVIEEADAVLAGEPDAWAQAWLDWARSGLALKVGHLDEAAAVLRRSVEGFASVTALTGIAPVMLGGTSNERGHPRVIAVGAAVASIRRSEMRKGE